MGEGVLSEEIKTVLYELLKAEKLALREAYAEDALDYESHAWHTGRVKLLESIIKSTFGEQL